MRQVRPALLQALILLGLSLTAGFVRQLAPDHLSWVGRWPQKSSSAEDAYNMMAKPGDPPFVSLLEAIDMERKQSAVFLDARTRDLFSQGRIPGARNLPYYDLEVFQEEALRGLTDASRIVIYCEGIGCELSFFLGRELKEAGYKDVRIFYGGYPEWTEAGLPIEK